MIEQYKAEEYQQVAALVCLDLDLLADMAGRLDLEQLRAQVQHTKKMKDRLIANPTERATRYQACCTVFSAAVAGQVRNDPVG